MKSKSLFISRFNSTQLPLPLSRGAKKGANLNTEFCDTIYEAKEAEISFIIEYVREMIDGCDNKREIIIDTSRLSIFTVLFRSAGLQRHLHKICNDSGKLLSIDITRSDDKNRRNKVTLKLSELPRISKELELQVA